MTTTTPDPIGPDLKTTLRRLKLGRLLDTLPERLAPARPQKMPPQDFPPPPLSPEGPPPPGPRGRAPPPRRRCGPRARPARAPRPGDAARDLGRDLQGLARPGAPERARVAPLPRHPRPCRRRRARRRRQDLPGARPRSHRLPPRPLRPRAARRQ